MSPAALAVEPLSKRLTAGLCLFHCGVPVKLLYRTSANRAGEKWKVRPLFVDDQTAIEVFIHKADHCSLLHTQSK